MNERPPWGVVAGLGAACASVGLVGLDLTASVVATFLVVLFAVFFLRHLAFALSALRSAAMDATAPVVAGDRLPAVSVLVACKNEAAVIERLIDGLAALDYPPDRLEMVVVDDGSTDGTAEVLDRAAARHPALHVVRRPPGAGGGKSGALNAALPHLAGEIVVVFDADHRPRPDVLRRLVRHFADPGVAAVQGRCVIANADDSPLARLIAVDYLAGYLVNEYGRQALFHLPAYGGANCAVRRSSLVACGGWSTGTVTEDTDLTLRLLLGGDRVRFDVTAVDEEEAVSDLARFWRQRYRWARGHQQVCRDFRAAAWRSPHLTLPEKIETQMFLHVFHLPVASAVGLVILCLWVAGLTTPHGPVDLFVLWTLLFLGPLLELGSGLLIAGTARREALVLAYFLPVFLVSIALCTKAWIDGVLGRPYAWVKTGRAGDVTDREAEVARR